MLIKNNRQGPIGIGHNSADKKGLAVMAKVTAVMPGVNHLDDKFWEGHKKNPTIVKHVKERILEVITEKDDETAAKKVGGSFAFGGMSEEEAEAVVKECLHVPVLQMFLKTDNRPRIQFAAKEQLDLLKLPSKKKEA